MTPKKTAKRWYGALRAVARPFLHAAMRIEVIGLANLPATGPAILVSNHRSSRDPQILTSVVPRYVAWVAAEYMSRVPVSGWIMKKIGVVFVPTLSRGNAAAFYKQALGVLQSGEILGLFPEGEDYIFANDFAAPPAPFHRGFAILALRAGVPVIPAAICPVEERLKPIQIPPSVRAELSQAHDMDQIQMIPAYQGVRVAFGAPLQAQASGSNNAVEELTERTRMVILELIERHGATRPTST